MQHKSLDLFFLWKVVCGLRTKDIHICDILVQTSHSDASRDAVTSSTEAKQKKSQLFPGDQLSSF